MHCYCQEKATIYCNSERQTDIKYFLDKKVNFKAQYFDKQALIKSLNISKNAVKCLTMIYIIAFFAKICVDAKS
jgi:hypothetical protein